MKSVFFYGLFMDPDRLKAQGLNPSRAELAQVSGYGLRIGQRATLECAFGERAYGSIMSLSDEDLVVLYSDETVADYIPERMIAIDSGGNPVNVLSYILPMDKVSGSNREYAGLLAITAKKLGLPDAYVREIKSWIDRQA